VLHLEKGAQASIAGAYSLAEQQKYAIRTRQHHYGKNAMSSVQFNGVAADQSFLNYQGTIVVEKNACNTNASQENKTILWGEASRALSIPALEVKTKEVQCAHGSAIGPLNKDHIHYAQSRGLSLKEAQRLLLTSFFAETLAILKDEDAKMRIIAKLLSHLLEK
jgi:Fe-S cluster assembly protein SufD